MTFARIRVEKFYPHSLLTIEGVYDGNASTELFSRGNNTAKFEPVGRAKYGASGSLALFSGGYAKDVGYTEPLRLKSFSNPNLVITNYGNLATPINGSNMILNNHSCASNEDNLMVTGGIASTTENTTSVQLKLFYSNTNAQLHGTLSQDRAGHGTAVNDDEVIISGGLSDNVSLLTTDKKTFSSNTTAVAHSGLVASNRMGVAVGSNSTDVLTVGGGAHSFREPVTSIDDYIQQFSFASSADAVSFGTLTQPVVAPFCGSDGGELVVIGGRTNDDVILQSGIRISFDRAGVYSTWGQLVGQKAFGAGCSDTTNIMISGGASEASNADSAYFTENCERILFADESSATLYGTLDHKYVDHSGAPGG